MRSGLVRLLGWPMPLFHADTAVLDRWLWLKERLSNDEKPGRLIELGCGTGAFTIGAALRGYEALGLSWDERNQSVAAERAAMCNARLARFEVQDLRDLDKREDLAGRFDVAICCEAIEHIIDDGKLMRDIAGCLKPNGRLLLTTPNVELRPIDPAHGGPFPEVENGGHVRKGYAPEDLYRLCSEARLVIDAISYCTGVLSQTITRLYFLAKKIHPFVAWAVIHPVRILPPLLDRRVTGLTRYPCYSICLEAHKERTDQE